MSLPRFVLLLAGVTVLLVACTSPNPTMKHIG